MSRIRPLQILIALSVIATAACGGGGYKWRAVVRDQGYWPLMTPDDALLPPGTIVVIKRDNPVQFYTVCAADAWGVTKQPTMGNGLSKLDADSKLSAALDIDIKKINATVKAKYENKQTVNVTKILLAELPTSDLYVTGGNASTQCYDDVIREQTTECGGKGCDVSVILGNFSANVSFSAAVTTEAGVDVDVEDAAKGLIGISASSTTDGEGNGLIWGIKYKNLPKLAPRVGTP